MRTKLLLLLLTISMLAQRSSAQLPASLQQHLQDTLNHMQALYKFKGLQAAVNYKNIGNWKGSSGVSQDGVPMADNMLIGIGSNTKTFVSAIMLKLYEDGQVNLTDTIGTWIQGYANINGAITIKQILNHTSGIFSYTEDPHFWDSVNLNMNKIWTKEELLHDFVGTPDFAPGASWNYSNTNYIIAGIIEEAITGRQMYQLLRDSIFNPVQLNETFFPPYETVTLPYAHYWTYIGHNYIEDASPYLSEELYSIANSAGGIVSTASDDAKFWQALFNGDIIKKSTLNNEMLQWVNISSTIGYGLGIFRERYLNNTVFDHGGTWVGQINSNLMDTARGIAITVLSNQDSLSNTFTEKVVTALYKVLLTNAPTAVNTINIAASENLFYPNPAKDQLFLKSADNKTKTVSITSIDGKEVFSRQFNAGQSVHIDLSNFYTGLYIATIIEDGQITDRQKIQIIK
ncbi:serine hydrolase [Taibaiella soli]|uniref:Beta-lactamase-related domain-containing protein n=1 Tax=Taibaiella soli TaxID=1649169 RepID=A0A2W2AJM8_9BACT|nr:serine hydrolase [Taibaiella soli]PZF72430.1 hypothetical protein DN068_13845 [Taibaiella soli]